MLTLEDARQISIKYWRAKYGGAAIVVDERVRDLKHGWMLSPRLLEPQTTPRWFGRSPDIIVDARSGDIFTFDSADFFRQYEIESYRQRRDCHGLPRNLLVYIRFDDWCEWADDASFDNDDNLQALYREQLAAFDANRKEILRIAFKWSLLESGAGLQWIEWLRNECSGVALIETDAARIQLIQELRQYPFLRAEEWEGRL